MNYKGNTSSCGTFWCTIWISNWRDWGKSWRNSK